MSSIIAVGQHSIIRIDSRIQARKAVKAMMRDLHHIRLPQPGRNRLKYQFLRLYIRISKPHDSTISGRHFQDNGSTIEIKKRKYLWILLRHCVFMSIQYIKANICQCDDLTIVKLQALNTRTEIPQCFLQHKDIRIIRMHRKRRKIVHHPLQYKTFRICPQQPYARRHMIIVSMCENPCRNMDLISFRNTGNPVQKTVHPLYCFRRTLQAMSPVN